MAHPLDGMIAAAKAGNPQALTGLANAQALGHFTPRDANAALDNLARAASLGGDDALRQLQVLARSTGADPATLRASIDLDAIQRPPSRRVLLQAPRVRGFEGFATAAECVWLIDRARARLRQASVYQDSSTSRQTHVGRSNTEADFGFRESDVVLAVIHDRIARATGVPAEHFEVAKLLHYNPGEAFMRHTDFLKPGPGMDEEIEARGQRVATFLLYLNDDYDGGETEFLDAAFKFKAKTGDGLLFVNVDAQDEPDLMSVHAGQPTSRGEKWLLSLWLRGKPVNAFQTPDIASAPLSAEWRRDV